MICLLTDFNEPRWCNTDWYFAEKLIKNLPEIMLGELNHPDRDIVDVTQVTHKIENSTIENKKVFGDVTFLNGLNPDNFRFSIRATSNIVNKTEYLQKIYAWDLILL